jgi:hypothetical protein
MAILHYASHEVPLIATFMAFHHQDSIPERHRGKYIYRQRTLNSYWAITTAAWKDIVSDRLTTRNFYWCGKIEGQFGQTGCRWCGGCLRDYFRTMENLR